MDTKISNTDPENTFLFLADLEPPKYVLEGTRGSLRNESDLRLLFTKHNKVAIQQPIIKEFTKQFDHNVFNALNIKWSKKPKFLGVSTTVGCLPDRECSFTWLRVEFELGNEIADSSIRPIVCGIYPETSQDEIRVIRNFEISSNLGFKLGEIETPHVSGGEKKATEYSKYNYHITTFGKMSSHLVWDFRATEVHPEIAGDFTLLFVAALPQKQIADSSITISAEVKYRSSLPSIPLLMKRTGKDAAKNTFRLNV